MKAVNCRNKKRKEEASRIMRNYIISKVHEASIMKKKILNTFETALALLSVFVIISCKDNKTLPPKVGTLTVYYSKEEIKDENHGCEKGKMYYDSNNLDVRFKSDDNNYIFECDMDDPDGVGVESWSIPKSKIEKKTYKMYQLSALEIGSKAVFVSDKGCTASIFWSNINGHKYCSWDGREVNWNETARYKECYVLSADIISKWDGEHYLFEIQLDESQGYIKLYDKTSVLGQEVMIGKLVASWTNEEGWDYKKSAYSVDGKLLADQWEIDGIPDELSIAYLAEENALYIEGDLYYRK